MQRFKDENRQRLYRVKCELNSDEYLNTDLTKIYLGIIDERDFPAAFESKNYSDIFFHEPRVIRERSSPKIQTTINCVHTLRGVNDDMAKHIDSWIRINRAFGVGKISFCLLDAKNEQTSMLKTRHGSFIEMVYFETSMERVCDKLKLTGTERGKRCVQSSFTEIFKIHSILEKTCADDW
jgi:hypothetical protein